MSKDKGVDSNRRAIIIGGAAAVAGIAAGIVIGGNAFPRTITQVQPEVTTVKQEETVTQTATTTTTTLQQLLQLQHLLRLLLKYQ